MRTPFDSAVELDDLLEETRGLCPEVWTGPERCSLADGAPASNCMLSPKAGHVRKRTFARGPRTVHRRFRRG